MSIFAGIYFAQGCSERLVTNEKPKVMLRFLVFQNGKPVSDWALINAHLIGADNIGVYSRITFFEGEIICEKRGVEPAALALQIRIDDVGELTLQTCLLPEQDEPYHLTLELARHRLMLLLTKQEDWLMFDLDDDHPAVVRCELARQLFIKALGKADDPSEVDRLACDSLKVAIDASEELALAHADRLLKRRYELGETISGAFGCGVGVKQDPSKIGSSILANFDYMTLPIRWRDIEPDEQRFNWQHSDNWAQWAFRNRLPIYSGPIISFDDTMIPDWLYVLGDDYQTLRDLFYEYTEQLVTRYRNVVSVWNTLSGVHVNKHFALTMDNLMDLTRMVVLLVKKIQPGARTLIEITQPFGEYYSNNQQSIPPLTYVDMILQAGIPVDAFGIRLLMGQAKDGQYTRDLMQISDLLDRLSAVGKPIHITHAGVPSQTVLRTEMYQPHANGITAEMPLGSGYIPDDEHYSENCGFWRKPWSATVQCHWLEAMYNIALSKPFIKSVSWLDMADHEQSDMPHSGLSMKNYTTKPAFHRIAPLRKAIYEGSAEQQSV